MTQLVILYSGLLSPALCKEFSINNVNKEKLRILPMQGNYVLSMTAVVNTGYQALFTYEKSFCGDHIHLWRNTSADFVTQIFLQFGLKDSL
jgi:hypothetical protein